MKKLILSLCLSAILFGMAGSVLAIKLPYFPVRVHEDPPVLIIPHKKSDVQDIIPQIIAASSSTTDSTIVAELEVKISEQNKQIEQLKAMLLELIAELQRQINELLNKV